MKTWTRMLLPVCLLQGRAVLAETAATGAEDRDEAVSAAVAKEADLPWFLPRDTPVSLGVPDPPYQQVMLSLGFNSISGDLEGAPVLLNAHYNAGVFHVGAGVGFGKLELRETDDRGDTRTATNDGQMYFADFGLGRNYGVRLYRGAELSVYLLTPAVDVTVGFVSGQDRNQTSPSTGSGEAPAVGVFSAALLGSGLRFDICGGFVLEARVPVLRGWVASRTFDPDDELGDSITAAGSSIGAEISVGKTFW